MFPPDLHRARRREAKPCCRRQGWRSSAARLAFILGFALPWRVAIPVGGGLLHPALFDLLILPIFVLAAISRTSWISRPDRRSLPIVLFALLVAGNARADAPLVAWATAWAALTGWTLARFDVEAALRGLEAGTVASVLVALAILPFSPETVTEGGRFAALVGTKNGFAFLAGLLAIRRAMTGDRRGLLLSLAWGVATIMTGSRGAILALLASALLVEGARHRVDAGRRARLLWLTVLAAAALLALAGMPFPSDRWEFASMIVEYWRHIPLLGIGAGSNFGLDLYAKSLLEFGWLGAALLAVILTTALRASAAGGQAVPPAPRTALLGGAAIRPLVFFLLIFGIAHDPTRWPLAWFLIAAGGGAAPKRQR